MQGKSGYEGFTLVEILVVIMIISVLAGAVSLTLNIRSDARQVAQVRDQLIRQIGYARDQAVFTQTLLGAELFHRQMRFLTVDEADYDFMTFGLVDAQDWDADTAANTQGAGVFAGSDAPSEQDLTTQPLSWQTRALDGALDNINLPEQMSFELVVQELELELDLTPRESQADNTVTALSAKPVFKPQLIFFPSGAIEPFKLTVRLDDSEVAYGLSVSRTGEIQRLEQAEQNN